MNFKVLLTSASILALSACSNQSDNQDSVLDYAAEAQRIAQETIILDGHIDIPYRLGSKWEDVSVATEGGDFDYPRAVAGGLNAPFMSIYTPAGLGDSEASTAHADKMIDIVERMVEESPDKFVIARNPVEVQAAFRAGKIALPLGLENGSPINGDMGNLEHFFTRGIRYITLAHSISNHISDSSYDEVRLWNGLSDFGKDVVVRMNELGIMVDISHLSDDAAAQILDMSPVPVIASHSSARTFTPGFERNMSDDLLKKLAENNGVIMINYGSSFIFMEPQDWGKALDAALTAKVEAGEIEDTPESRSAFALEYREANPYPYATLSQVADHIDHVVKVAGIDTVGLGSDYDGVGDSLPIGLKDASTFPNLIEELLKRGYSEADISKILSGNALRVWSAVEAHAEKVRTGEIPLQSEPLVEPASPDMSDEDEEAAAE